MWTAPTCSSRAKPNVNVKRSDGTTPLMMASAAGVPPIVQELMSHHADVQAKDLDDSTALTLAASGWVMSGRPDVALGGKAAPR